MFIRAGMNAFLDPSVGKLDTISAEPLRVWSVTGSTEAIEAFRGAVGGVVIPDEDIFAVKTAGEVAKEVAVKTEQVAVLQASLEVATAELETVTAQMAAIPVNPADEPAVIAIKST